MKLVLTTAPPAKAEEIARALVEEKLCACAQVLPPMRSVYWWKGKVENAEERLILLKTDEAHLERLEARLTELHPYDVPEFVAMEVAHASAAYSSWLKEVMDG
jgi:periplasmic divalent cation tolerance protein